MAGPAGSKGRAGRQALPALILAVATCLAFASSFRGVLVGDDVTAIAENPHIRSLTFPDSLRAPANTTAAGRPVVAFSLALNYALAPRDARETFAGGGESELFRRNLHGYHLFNLLVHVLAALTLFGVVRRTLLAAAPRWFTGSAREAEALALSVALLWAVHPIQTSAVTYVVQRAEALVGLFFLFTLYCVVRGTQDSRARGWWIAASIVACALGMATKEVMVAAPLVAGVWLWALPPAVPRLTRSGWFLGLASTWLLLAWLVSGDVRDQSVGVGLGGWTVWTYLATQAAVVVHYLRVVFDPSALAFMYDWPRATSIRVVWPQFALLTGLGALTLMLLLRRHPAALPGAVFFLVLAPTSSLLPIVTAVAAPHRMYLPLAAVVATLVLSGHWLLRRAAPAALRYAWVVVALGAVVLGALTHARNMHYWSVEALMRDTVAKRPHDIRARVALGGELLKEERYAEAEREFRAALANARTRESAGPLLPDEAGAVAVAHMYLGAALGGQGRVEEGIRELERALAASPELSEAHGMLGEAYASMGRHAEAVASFERSIELIRDAPPLLVRAARLRATSPDSDVRDGARAVLHARRALDLTNGRDLFVLDTLAAAYAEQGQFPEAIAVARRGEQLARAANDLNAAALFQRRVALYRAGRPLRE